MVNHLTQTTHTDSDISLHGILFSELNVAFQYFFENNWEINLEKYNHFMERGESLSGQKLFPDAYRCFSKAAFVAKIMEPSGDLLV